MKEAHGKRCELASRTTNRWENELREPVLGKSSHDFGNGTAQSRRFPGLPERHRRSAGSRANPSEKQEVTQSPSGTETYLIRWAEAHASLQSGGSRFRLPERNLTRLFFFATAKLNIRGWIDHHRRRVRDAEIRSRKEIYGRRQQ